MMFDLFILFALLILSAWFSSTEMAYVIANKIKIEINARKKIFSATSSLFFANNSKAFFSTILIGNNIANVAFASISAVLLSELFGWSDWTILFVTTIFVLILGELIPKYIAHEIADFYFPISAVPLRIVYFILYPLIQISSKFSSLFIKTKNLSEENISGLFNREDIEHMINESKETGNVDEKETSIIRNVLELGEQRVYEALSPRTEIVGVEINFTIDEVIQTFVESGFSKLPVYEENLDNIKGMVLAHDIFRMPEDLRSILREVIYVPETKKSIEMLNDFLRQGISIAVVVDEFGGTVGIVTMEDIIEELFGEIKDEYDVDENICRRISDNSYIISGKVEIDHINEMFNIDIPVGDFETIAGFIFDNIGRIPISGEVLRIDRFEILIARVNQIRIDLIKLTIIDESA